MALHPSRSSPRIYLERVAHYVFTGVDDPAERSFYEVEATAEGWSDVDVATGEFGSGSTVTEWGSRVL
jgi:hypothetical protein